MVVQSMTFKLRIRAFAICKLCVGAAAALQPGRGAEAALHCRHHVTICPAQDYLLAMVLQQSA